MLSFAETIGDFKLEPTITMNDAIGFMTAMLLGTGVAFELPVIMGVLGWLGIVKWRMLWRFNKYALILAFVVGGVLTPGPDVLSQVLMSVPLFLLYNVSILIVWLIERAARQRLAQLAKETGADLVPVEDTDLDKK
jgi:sec-independent protein translocase protein TatC